MRDRIGRKTQVGVGDLRRLKSLQRLLSKIRYEYVQVDYGMFVHRNSEMLDVDIYKFEPLP